MNEKELFKKRISELSNRAYQRGYSTYSNFLNMDEISTVLATDLQLKPNLFGGYNNAERCVCGFGDELYFPIVCVEIKPSQQKFADKLSHRDFLGSLMNLGIEREMLGDIKINDNVGYLFCLDKISEYIVENLNRIKHTTVKCEIIDEIPEFLNETPEAEEIIVSSIRIDTVVAKVFNMSRNAVSQLVNQQKIFINSKLIYKDSILLKENDIVSVRGYGKFIYVEPINETKKHKIVISVIKYK